MKGRQIHKRVEAERRKRNPMPAQTRDRLMSEIQAEVLRAARHGAQFASLHEAYAVILEELDEVWEITRLKKRDREASKIRKELIQLGAMAVKAIESMENFVGGTV